MLTRITRSNCPLYICYAILRGLAVRVVATKSPVWFYPFHFGAVDERERVTHFKRTVDGQPWAPFWFEGTVRRTKLSTVRRAGVLFIIPAWLFMLLMAPFICAVLPTWMVVSALYWPIWMIQWTAHAIARRRRWTRGRLSGRIGTSSTGKR